MTEAPDNPETVSLFSIWKSHPEELRPFGEICRLAREGAIPGTVEIPGERSPRILTEKVQAALLILKKDAA